MKVHTALACSLFGLAHPTFANLKRGDRAVQAVDDDGFATDDNVVVIVIDAPQDGNLFGVDSAQDAALATEDAALTSDDWRYWAICSGTDFNPNGCIGVTSCDPGTEIEMVSVTGTNWVDGIGWFFHEDGLVESRNCQGMYITGKVGLPLQIHTVGKRGYLQKFQLTFGTNARHLQIKVKGGKYSGLRIFQDSDKSLSLKANENLKAQAWELCGSQYCPWNNA